MALEPVADRWLRRSAIAIGVFTFAALLFTGQVWTDYAYANHRISWLAAFAVALAEWEPWAVAAPFVVFLAERAPFGRGRTTRALFVHVPAAIVICVAKLGVGAALTRVILGPVMGPFTFLRVYLTLLTYCAIVVVTHVARRYRLAREHELQASRLEAALAGAQVEALKMQLHPHFLFNTLNAVTDLMHQDVEAADAMLANLSELLRRTFESADVQEVTLGRELEFIDSYLSIQQVRHGDRLTVAVAATEEVRNALVPTLILQPLVENAIRHGVEATPGRGRVDIRATCRGDRLRIEVTDDGPGPPEPVRDGYGLRNIRARLRVLYAGQASLTLSRGVPRGAIAALELPARRVDAP